MNNIYYQLKHHLLNDCFSLLNTQISQQILLVPTSISYEEVITRLESFEQQYLASTNRRLILHYSRTQSSKEYQQTIVLNENHQHQNQTNGQQININRLNIDGLNVDQTKDETVENVICNKLLFLCKNGVKDVSSVLNVTVNSRNDARVSFVEQPLGTQWNQAIDADPSLDSTLSSESITSSHLSHDHFNNYITSPLNFHNNPTHLPISQNVHNSLINSNYKYYSTVLPHYNYFPQTIQIIFSQFLPLITLPQPRILEFPLPTSSIFLEYNESNHHNDILSIQYNHKNQVYYQISKNLIVNRTSYNKLNLFIVRHVKQVQKLKSHEEIIRDKLLLARIKNILKTITNDQIYIEQPKHILQELLDIINQLKDINIFKILPNYVLSNIEISQKFNTVILKIHSKHYGVLRCLGDTGSDVNLMNHLTFDSVSKFEKVLKKKIVVGVCNGHATLELCLQIVLYRSDGVPVATTFYKSTDLLYDYLIGNEGLHGLGLIVEIKDIHSLNKKVDLFHQKFVSQGDDPVIQQNYNILSGEVASYINSKEEPNPRRRHFVNKCIKLTRSMEATEEYDVGTAANFTYQFQPIPNWTPFTDPIIPTKTTHKKKLDKLLDDLTGVIWERSTSPNYCNAYLMSKDLPDGSSKDRLVINFKKLNQRTQKLYYKLTTLEDVFNTLYGCTLYTSIDINKAFYHMIIPTNVRDFFSFITQKGLYRLIRMIYGHCTAPMQFQKLIEETIRFLDAVLAFMDDLLVFTTDNFDKTLFIDRYQYHFNNVVPVLERLKQRGFKSSSVKCSWMKTELIYVGRI